MSFGQRKSTDQAPVHRAICNRMNRILVPFVSFLFLLIVNKEWESNEGLRTIQTIEMHIQLTSLTRMKSESVILLLLFCFLIDNSVTLENPYQVQNSIVNRHDFFYLLNPALEVCDSNVYLLVYVHSSVENYQRRSIIRETWASRVIFPHLRLVFMLGKSSNQILMQSVAYEFELYRDIVQEDFIDSYKNLTYKGVMALKWASIYCSRAKYILKSDDDVIINTFTLIKHLEHLERYQINLEQMILCLMWQSMPVVRDKFVEHRYTTDHHGMII